MPAYNYECQDCKKVYEDYLKIENRNDSVCECGSKNTKKIPAAPPVHFKGEGWTQKMSHGPGRSLERKIEDGNITKKDIEAH